MGKKKKLLPTLSVSLIVASLTIIAPIIWDYWKTSSALELRLLTEITVVEPGLQIPRLKINYGETSCKEIRVLEFRLANTGRTPFRYEDVIRFPTICLEPYQILDASITEKTPADLTADVVMPPSGSEIAINFELLNPGDQIKMTIIIGLKDVEPTAQTKLTEATVVRFEGVKTTFATSARISGLYSMDVNSAVTSNGQFWIALKSVSWYVYIVLLVSVYFWYLIVFESIPDYKRQKLLLAMVRKWAVNNEKLTAAHIDAICSLLITSATDPIKVKIDALEKQIKANPEKTELVSNQLVDVIEKKISLEIWASVIVVLLALFGTFFVLTSFM
jgi:hypothetical protein